MIQLSEQYAQIWSISLKRPKKSRKSQPQAQALHLQNTKHDNAYQEIQTILYIKRVVTLLYKLRYTAFHPFTIFEF